MSLPEKLISADEQSLPQPYEDAREWLDIVDSMGELKRIDGADWNLEKGHSSRALIDACKPYERRDTLKG